MVQFITSYAEDHALVLPGRVPGFKRDDIKILPSSHGKGKIYASYIDSLKESQTRVVGESSFFSLWQQLTPFVVCAKPMTDLCWTCQKNNTLIYRFYIFRIAWRLPFKILFAFSGGLRGSCLLSLLSSLIPSPFLSFHLLPSYSLIPRFDSTDRQIETSDCCFMLFAVDAASLTSTLIQKKLNECLIVCMFKTVKTV